MLLDGEAVGEVTSGNFSPMLDHGIALAFLPPDVADGTEVTIDVRGDPLPGRSSHCRSGTRLTVRAAVASARQEPIDYS